MRLIQDGSPERSQQMPDGTYEYFRFRNDNVILYESRMVIPKYLRQKSLGGLTLCPSRSFINSLWSGYLGTLARQYARHVSIGMRGMQYYGYISSECTVSTTHPSAVSISIGLCTLFRSQRSKIPFFANRFTIWPSVLKTGDWGSAKQLVEVQKHFCKELASGDELHFTDTEKNFFLIY